MKHHILRNALIVCIFFSKIVCSTVLVAGEAWEEYYADEHLRIEFLKQDCDIPSSSFHNVYQFLKFTNLTEDAIEVTYNQKLWYNGKCITCNRSDEHQYTVRLNPNEEKNGKCDRHIDKSLQIFHSMIKPENPSVLTHFELEQIRIVTIR